MWTATGSPSPGSAARAALPVTAAHESATRDSDSAALAIRAVGLAATAPRCAVYRVLAGRDRPCGAGEVFDLLRAQGVTLGLPSVYRVLHSFTTAGLVHAFPGEEQRFRVCGRDSHAHLVCERCGRVIERPTQTVRGWLSPTRQDSDFIANVEHSDLYGVCGRCREGVS